MIEPTVARLVYYYASIEAHQDNLPCAALVVDVKRGHGQHTLSLQVFGRDGNTFYRPSVLLHQAESEMTLPEHKEFCEWMPYQKGQAAKTEALVEQVRIFQEGDSR